MKIIVSAVLLFVGIVTLQAQKTFEGTVIYTYKMEGENAGLMAGFMPDKMVMKYGRKSMITLMEGGMMGDMMGKIVVDGVNNEAFVVKEAEKTVYLMKPEDAGDVEEPQIKEMVRQKEEEDILGYRCRRYKMIMEMDGEETTQYIWVTEELKAPDLQLPGIKAIAGGVLSGSKLPGFPLRIEVVIANTSTTLVMTASEIDPTPVNAKEFQRPRDFAVKDFSELLGSGNR